MVVERLAGCTCAFRARSVLHQGPREAGPGDGQGALVRTDGRPALIRENLRDGVSEKRRGETT